MSLPNAGSGNTLQGLRNVEGATAKKVPAAYSVKVNVCQRCTACSKSLTSADGQLCTNCQRMQRFGIGVSPMPGAPNLDSRGGSVPPRQA